MSSKSKRRVTVDTGNTVTEDAEKRKPSVFERLGPGAGQRKYSEYDSEREKKCRPFLMTGECPYGATCKYKHVQLSRKSKTREDDTSPENLRLKLKSGQSERSSDKRRDSDSESHDAQQSRSASRSRRDKDGEAGDRPDRSSSHSRRDKETKIKSQVVVKKSENQDSDDSGDDSESNWFSSLDYKKELELEQKRQQLQRELSQLAEEEVENITIQKKVPASQSGSDSSPERGRSSKHVTPPRSTSPSGRGKKDKKKHHTRSPPDPPPHKDKKAASPGPDKGRDHKRKHETEEESHKKHKKNKKERKRSLSPEVKSKRKDFESSVSRSESTSASRQHAQSHSKRSRSSSSDSSMSPPRSKDGKGKAKVKAKKKKNRAGKGDSDSDEPSKSKKWLSPLKKTLKLKKGKAGGGSAETKMDEERGKRSSSPKSSGRGDRRELLAEDPMPPRSQDSRRDADTGRSRDHSVEKRDKKVKGRRSESPPAERGGGGRRGDSSRDTSFTRKGRQSESPVHPSERASKRGESARDASYDRRKGDQRDRSDTRKGGADDRPKRPPTPPRQGEMYSPSQLDRDSPARDHSQRQQAQPSRGRQGAQHADRDSQRDDDRRGQDRDGRRGDKFDSRSSASTQDRAGSDRFSRRGNNDSFEQFGQDRGRFDADRNRWEFREGRAPEAGSGDREQRGRRGDHFERGLSQREQARTEGMGRDASFDRQEGVRGSGGRDSARDSDGRDRSRDAARDRGDNRESRDRDGRGANDGGKYGGSAYGPDGQRRSGQWDSSGRGGEWGTDRPGTGRDLAGGRADERGRGPGGSGSVSSGGSGGRMFRDDGRDGGDRRGRELPPDARPPMEGQRMERPDARMDRGDLRLERGDSRLDRGDNRLDRGDSRLDRGDNRLERGDGRADARLDRGDARLDRGDSRSDRGDRTLVRGEGRVEGRDSRMDRAEGRLDRNDSRMERGDGQIDLRRGEPPVADLDQRGFRQGRGGAPGLLDNQPGMRGIGRHSPVDNRSFEFDRRGSGLRDDAGVRLGERDGRMDRERDREPAVLAGLPPRERFPGEFRRDDPGFRDPVPEGLLRDRRPDDRFMGHDARDQPPRGDRRFDDSRDDRLTPRGQMDDRQGRDRMPRRGGPPYEYGRGPVPDVRPPDLPPNQRRGPLLPTPLEEVPRRRDPYEREVPRVGREGVRDLRDDRSQRDQREGDFGPDMGRGIREGPRDAGRDPMWEREVGKDRRGLDRNTPRDSPRDLANRRGRGTPTEEALVDPDRSRDGERLDSGRRDRDRSPRREVDKLKEGTTAGDGEGGKRHLDKKEEGQRGEASREGVREKVDVCDARSTRSADDVRELASQRSKKDEGEAATGRAGRGGRERDSQSDGKRSPVRSQGKERSPLPLGQRRQPAKARSLSPKQRRLTPPASAPGGRRSSRSPAKPRSPGRRGAEVASPMSKPGSQERSRTPLGTKRKAEDDLRSPGSSRVKDDTKSPASKRPREDSKSPVRRSSRHPSPAGSHHSRGSHSSVERRRRAGLTQREAEPRFFGSGHDRDSPARRERERDRDRERESPAWRERERERDSPSRRDREREKDSTAKGEKAGDASKGEGDLTRKRGRSPPRSLGRGSDSGERGRKRWRGEKVHPSVEAAWEAGFEPADIENKLADVVDKFRQTNLLSKTRNLVAQKVVLDKRYERERLICESDDLLILYDCKRASMLDWFIRKEHKCMLTHFEEDAQNCVRVWSGVSTAKYQPYCAMLSQQTLILSAAVRRFLDGTWAETDAGEGADKDGHRQKSGSVEQLRVPEPFGEAADASRPDAPKPLSSLPSPAGGAVPGDSGKSGRQGRGDSFSNRNGEERGSQDGRPGRGEDSFQRPDARPGAPGDGSFRGDTPVNQDSNEDSKDASLSNMLYEDDYEKISSDESDFEADEGEKQSQNICSVLDIDWASLSKQPTPKQTTGSLVRRFHPASVFRQIGVSRALAGDALFEKVKAICEGGVKAEEVQSKENKENVDKADDSAATEKGVNKMETTLLSDSPVLHMATVRQRRERSNLLRNLGPFRRALCARRDLEIRRQLCKVDKVYEQPAVFPTHVMDADLCKLSIQLFRQGRDFIDRKDSECDSKIELTI